MRRLSFLILLPVFGTSLLGDPKELFHTNQDKIFRIRNNYGDRPTGSGSSFIVQLENKNYLVTNYHVLAGGVFYVEQSGKKVENLTVLRADDTEYIAILTFDGIEKTKAIPLVPVDATEGDKVYALGFPVITDDRDVRLTITDGLVSNSQLIVRRGALGDKRYIQVSAAINPGNSGGPIFTEQGNLIGMSTWKRVDLSSVGAAIPTSDLIAEIRKIPDGKRTVESETPLLRSRFDLIAEAVKEKRLLDFGHYYAPSVKQKVYPDALKAAERIRNAATLGSARFKTDQDGFVRYLAGQLSPEEFFFYIVLTNFFSKNPTTNVNTVAADPSLASHLYLAARFFYFFQKLAGVRVNDLEYKSYEVKKIDIGEDLKTAEADIQVTLANNKQFPVHLKFAYEWGNWFLMPSYTE